MSHVPAATRTLRVLRFLSSQVDPVPIEAIMRACELPRSTTYHLVNAMIDEGFVVHLADERRYGLGVGAFEVGGGYARQAPLQRIARRPLAHLVDQTTQSAHLAVLHGRDVLYVLEDRAPGRPPLVTDVGVRLPAHLTASGRAIMAALPAEQVRALYPDRTAFSDRTGLGPRSPTALRAVLAETRRRGYALEDGDVTRGLASIAVPVLDHNEHPIAAVALTFVAADVAADVDAAPLVGAVTHVAELLSERIGGSSQHVARVTNSAPQAVD